MRGNYTNYVLSYLTTLNTIRKNNLAKLENWRSGKTGTLAKLGLWQNLHALWRSSGKTGALTRLALWQTGTSNSGKIFFKILHYFGVWTYAIQSR